MLPVIPIPPAINQANDCELARVMNSEHSNDNRVTLMTTNPLKTTVTSHSNSATAPQHGCGRPWKEPQTSAQVVQPKCKHGRPCKQQQVAMEPPLKRKRG